MSFRFHVLGAMELTGLGQEDVRAVVTQPKRLAILAYLLLAQPPGYHRRDSLLALFWPDLGMEEARRALRQSLHFLRQHLGAATLLNRGTDEVAAAPETIQCDALEFRALLAAGKDEEALARYRGDLLPGFHVDGAAPEFDEWMERARAELRRQALGAMRRMAEQHAKAGRLPDAAAWASRVMALPVAEERDLVRAMQLFREAGDTGAARELYDAYARRLKSQYGSEPGPAARALRLELRAPGSAPVPPPAGGPPAPSPEIQPASPPVAPGPAGAPPPRRRWWAAALVLAGLAIAGVAIRGWERDLAPAQPMALDAPRIAVAVFVNQTGDSTLEPLGTMVSDWVMRGLTRVTPLQVVDVGAIYASGRTDRGVPRDPRELAAENGATLAVGGTYYRAGRDSLLLNARVLDVSTGEVLRKVDSVWSTRAEPLSGARELSDRLTSAVASIVNPQAFHISAAAQPPGYEAFREYVRGAEIYWAGRFQEALPLIRRAGEMDPAFTWARVFTGVVAAGIGRCDLTDSLTARLLSEQGSALQEIERVTLDLSMARCRTDWFEALQQQRRRIELLPGATFPRWGAALAARQANRPAMAMTFFETVDPVHGLGWLGQRRTLYWREVTAALHGLGEYQGERHLADSLLRAGQDPLAATYYLARSYAALGMDDALPELLAGAGGLPPDPALVAAQSAGKLRATELASPGYLLNEVGAELAAHGRPAQGRAVATRAIEWLSGGDAGAAITIERRYLLGRALLLAERPAEARSVFDDLAREEPAIPEFRALAGVAAARQGDRRSAEATLAWLATLQHPWPPGLAPYYRAAVAAALGDIPGALDLIESLPYGSHPFDVLQFHVDPILAPLHGTERFRRFIAPKG